MSALETTGLGMVPIVIERRAAASAPTTSTAGCCASGSSSWSARSTTRPPTWWSRRCCSWRARTPTRTSHLYINSPGGIVSAGLAIYDTMQFVKPDVSTLCMGMAASMGSFLLMAGAKGKRLALPNSRVMIHQPSGGAQGQATDIEIHAREILKTREQLNRIYAERTGQPIEKIRADMERDFFMDRRGVEGLRPDRPGARASAARSATAERAATRRRVGLQQRRTGPFSERRPRFLFHYHCQPCNSPPHPTTFMAEKKGSSSEKVLYCSFCGKSQHEVKKLIAGPSVFICDECIELCNDIIRDEVPADGGDREGARSPTCRCPSEIKASLDQYVIGQEVAKRTLSVAVYNHYKRLKHMSRTKDEVELIEEQHPADRPDRLGQDAARADAGAPAQRAVRDRRRDDADRSRLRRRGRREHHPEAAAELQLRRRAGAARHRLHRRDRQDHRARPTTPRSPATSRARACSRRC